MRQEKSVYSFMTREGDDDSAFRINEGKFKGTIYQYSDITLPEEDKGNLRLSFKFDILDIIPAIVLERYKTISF